MRQSTYLDADALVGLQDLFVHRLVIGSTIAELDIINQLSHGRMLTANGTILLFAAKFHGAEHGVAHATKDQEAGMIERGCSQSDFDGLQCLQCTNHTRHYMHHVSENNQPLLNQDTLPTPKTPLSTHLPTVDAGGGTG